MKGRLYSRRTGAEEGSVADRLGAGVVVEGMESGTGGGAQSCLHSQAAYFITGRYNLGGRSMTVVHVLRTCWFLASCLLVLFFFFSPRPRLKPRRGLLD